MESFALYLLKSVIWLTGFALVYVLFLRNERFFLLNRIYLVAGLVVSLLFPFVTVHYTVELPLLGIAQAGDAVAYMVNDTAAIDRHLVALILLSGYLAGVAFFLWIVLRQTARIIGIVRQSDAVPFNGARLVKSSVNSHAFSFFSFVFVNPSISDSETREIVNHEMVHIRQKHWLDLVLAELLRTLQWFNPLAWIYIRFIKQNHEYLADREALQQTSDPAVYRAVLLNQITGSPVVSLANSFHYSINKKRFNMMKNIVSSPYRKMKLLLILPVFAIVLYAFAIPEYHYVLPEGNNPVIPAPQGKEVRGKVVRQDGKPLEGSSVVLVGTTIGTTTDPDGKFKLADVPGDAALAVTYVGYKSKVVKAVFNSDMTISMVRDTVRFGSTSIPPPPPPPPPSAGSKQGTYGAIPPPPPPPPPGTGEAVSVRGTGPEPLYYVDGKPSSKEEISKINPNDIQAIKVLKGETGVKLYGEKGRDGVIEVELKSADARSTGEVLPNDKLIILDGKEMNVDLKTLDANTIENVNVLKGESAVSKYGEKGKNGVIIITSKKSDPSLEPVTVVGQPLKPGQKAAPGSGSSLESVTVVGYGTKEKNKEVMTIVEQLPEFPGGKGAMDQWIQSNLKYPADAVKAGKEGTVNVSFLVETSGKVSDVKVIKSVDPKLDAEARRVVSFMPNFNPGLQAGKPVDVQMMVSVVFSLK